MNKILQVLVITKGHDFDHNALLAMFESMPQVQATLVQHPAAQVLLQADNASRYDAVFFYDMCGIPGIGLQHDNADDDGMPSRAYAASIAELLAAGMGLVLVNHATVSWPNWPLWREITGSSFMLQAGELHGKMVPGSGYRGGHGPLEPATIKLIPQQSHPVLEGLNKGFTLTDELYLKTADYEANVVPLLRGNYEFTMANFTPPPLASAAEQADWNHPDGSDLIVWANSAGNSPIVVSDVGDGPLAFDNPAYRHLIENALRWVASIAAKQWAAAKALAN